MRSEKYLEDLEAKVQAKCERDLKTIRQAREALKQVRAIADEYGESADLSNIVSGIIGQTASRIEEERVPDSHEQNGLEDRFSLRREIEAILPEFGAGNDVTQGGVREKLIERFPNHEASIQPASISSSLRRIASAGGLVLVSEGSGSQPNRYRLPEQASDSESQEELSELRE